MPFQFIDHNSGLDAAAKRRIRKHAALGKNLGRTIARPSRNIAQRPTQPKTASLGLQTRSLPSPSSSGDEHGQDATFAVLDRQIGDGLSVIFLPADRSGQSASLIHKAITFFCRMHYTPGLFNAFEPHTGPPSMWFQLTFEDAAYFHVAMAISIASFDNSKNTTNEKDSLLAMRHLNQTFQLVNHRLSQANAASDACMAVVVMMAQYERHRERYFKGLLHVEGLHRMVEMRGGISQLLEAQPSLAQKIARLDLDYALYLGTGTRFDVADIINGSRSWSWFRDSCRKEYQEQPSSLGKLSNLCMELRELAQEMTWLAALLKDANSGNRPALNTRAFHNTLLVLGYRLLHFSPLGETRPIFYLDNAIHLGLVAYLKPFMYRFDGKISENPLLSQLLRSTIQKNFGNDLHTQEILLWVILVSAGAAGLFADQEDDEWLMSLISRTMQQLGLQKWEDVAQKMERYPWIEALHNKAGQDLCSRATSFYPITNSVLQSEKTSLDG